MKVQTTLSYEALARALDLDPGLKIELVEVDRLKGQLQIVVTGDLPPRTVTANGFSPSDKRWGSEPDSVNINYLTRED